MTSLPEARYLSNDYLGHNPTWHQVDSPWKASLLARLLLANGVYPESLCEVGCGAGAVLAQLHTHFPQAALVGYDIAPDAAAFWPHHQGSGISFRLGDFLVENDRSYDVVAMLDVLEHLTDPFTFLRRLRGHAEHYAFIIPLDLSALSLLRKNPLLRQRETVGHIHYFTKDLALSLLRETGYDVVDWTYSGATFHTPIRTWKTKLASVPRALTYGISKDWGVRALGGETLVVLAR